MNEDEAIQRDVCKRWGSLYIPTDLDSMIGIAANVREGVYPLNGLRHPICGKASGWYIWAGEEMSKSEDFFLPLHVEHLDEWNLSVKMYLGLAPGWRFLAAPGYEDVWFDASLLTG